MSRLSSVIGIVLWLALAGCQPAEDQAGSASTPTGAASITVEDLTAHIKTLAADEFGGRAPGTPGGRKTVDYLSRQFAAMGLEPGFGDSWTQAVPLVAITADPDMSLRITGGNEPLELAYKREMMAWTKRVTERVELDASELVFVGYGIVAPEYGWNDYAGLDVEGKTVVILVNDPGYATGDPELFNGKAMTYYGRWTYKYEEAARQGAAGAIIVHETDPAGYPWEVVSGSWSGEQYDLQSANRNMHRVKVEGWITHDAAERLFAAAGQSYEKLKAAAAERGFQAVPLDLEASIAISNSLRNTESHNVMGMLRGSKRPDEYVIYTAHWDHMGTDPSLEGDQIYNGAQDNATGVAAVLEIAQAFAGLETPPERSVLFLAVTAEESGLLGSRWFGENPPVPLRQIVGGINMDSMPTYGPTKDVVVVGYGKSELEEYLRRAASGQDRVLVPENTPEKGFYYRSDHFNLAKFGVPMLYAKSGIDHLEKGKDYGRRMQEEYVSERYHKPGDEYSESWDLRGLRQDARLFFNVGQALANTAEWPNWYEGTEFRAIRDASRQAGAN